MDPLSYFVGSAILSGAFETGKYVVSAAASGLVGNSFHNAVVHKIPEIRQFFQGAGQPTNHHLQRALRTAYLAATRRLLENARAEATHLSASRIDDDCSAWCDQALVWVKGQSDLLKDEKYQPPMLPGAWDPVHIVERQALDAAAEVAALRESLSGMLIKEWADAGLRMPPAPVLQALANGWTPQNSGTSAGTVSWFEEIGLYFANEIKAQPQVQAIFQASTLSKILIELRAFREESGQSRSRRGAPPFFAPSATSYFVGRESLLLLLAERLAKPGAVVPLTGMPGLGKTSLAIAFAHQRQSDFEAVYWISCAGQSLSSCAVELAAQLGIKFEGDPESELRNLRRTCAEQHCLLVLDNIEQNEIGGLVPGGRCAVLVTTRLAGLPFLAKYRSLEVDLFTPEECLAAFSEYLPAAEVSRHGHGYMELAEHLGRLPLAIAVAGGLLRNDLRYTLDRLLSEPQLHKLAHGELDISRLLGAAIASVSAEGRGLLSAMAVCAPSGFRLALAAEIIGIDEQAAVTVLQDLRSRSLVEIYDVEKLRCRLHSLIRAEAGQAAAQETRHARAIARRFSRWEESWRECEEDVNDWRLALTWAAGQKVSAAELANTFGSLASDGFHFAYRRGLLPDALKAMELAAESAVLVGNTDWLQASYGNQALILKDWGRLEDAMALHKKEEAICLELGLRDSLRISLHNQAIILDELGQSGEAGRLRAEAEAIHAELMWGRGTSA